jgi:hypothetical protein
MRANYSRAAVEGGLASNNPFVSMLSGVPLAAGAAGVIMGRFGWHDPITGQVSNQRGANGATLGFVLPSWGSWNRQYAEDGTWILRSGQRITLASRGDFWCRFATGAYPGQQVFANINDGSAACGSTVSGGWTADSDIVTADSTFYTADGGGGYQLTQWVAASQACPGALAVITPWATFSNMQ